jgi:hypothetical protein
MLPLPSLVLRRSTSRGDVEICFQLSLSERLSPLGHRRRRSMDLDVQGKF